MLSNESFIKCYLRGFFSSRKFSMARRNNFRALSSYFLSSELKSNYRTYVSKIFAFHLISCAGAAGRNWSGQFIVRRVEWNCEDIHKIALGSFEAFLVCISSFVGSTVAGNRPSLIGNPYEELCHCHDLLGPATIFAWKTWKKKVFICMSSTRDSRICSMLGGFYE